MGTCLCVLGREIKKLVPALSTELIMGTVFACRVSHLFLVHCSYNNFLNSFFLVVFYLVDKARNISLHLCEACVFIAYCVQLWSFYPPKISL